MFLSLISISLTVQSLSPILSVGGPGGKKEGKGQPAPSAANMLTSFGNFLRRLRNVGRAWHTLPQHVDSRDNLQLILSLSVVDHFDGNFHIRFLGTLMAGFLSVERERERDDDFNQMPHTKFRNQTFSLPDKKVHRRHNPIKSTQITPFHRHNT